MSKGFEFKLDYAGIGELMKSTEMQNVLISFAEQVAGRAGDGYSVYVGPTRANVSVETKSEAAKRDNYENNTLEKVIR